MAPAQKTLGRLARAISTHDARTRLLSNADGQVVQSGREYHPPGHPDHQPRPLGPVHGEHGRPGRHRSAGTAPAGTLTGIAKRNMPGVEVFSLNTPDQLADARAFALRHSEPERASIMNVTPSWMMVVSPPRVSSTPPRCRRRSAAGPGRRRRLGGEPPRNHRGHHPARRHRHRAAGRRGRPGLPGQPIIRLYPVAQEVQL